MWHPQYLCPRIARDLVSTGKVDDPCWQHTEAVLLTDPIDGSAKRYQRASLLYNTRYLYIAFTCEDEYVWGSYTERDSPIFTEECVEAFICPSGKMRQYYEINVSPRNTVFDAFILNGSEPEGDRRMISFVEYTCEGLITCVHLEENSACPVQQDGRSNMRSPSARSSATIISPLEPGDEWRLNLYRIDSTVRDVLDFSAWATMGKNDFHLPERFGTLRFL